MRKLRFPSAALLLILGLALGACGGSTSDSGESDASELGQGSSIQGIAAQDRASDTDTVAVPERLDFLVTLYQGEEQLGASELSFGSLLGGKPIVLNFWASNCPPCAAEMPEFQRVYEAFKGKVLFFGLDVGGFSGFGGPEDSARELIDLGVTYPAASAPDVETVRRLRVIGLPSTDFITPEGTVLRNWTGMLNEERLTELVEELLSAS